MTGLNALSNLTYTELRNLLAAIMEASDAASCSEVLSLFEVLHQATLYGKIDKKIVQTDVNNFYKALSPLEGSALCAKAIVFLQAFNKGYFNLKANQSALKEEFRLFMLQLKKLPFNEGFHYFKKWLEESVSTMVNSIALESFTENNNDKLSRVLNDKPAEAFWLNFTWITINYFSEKRNDPEILKISFEIFQKASQEKCKTDVKKAEALQQALACYFTMMGTYLPASFIKDYIIFSQYFQGRSLNKLHEFAFNEAKSIAAIAENKVPLSMKLLENPSDQMMEDEDIQKFSAVTLMHSINESQKLNTPGLLRKP